METRTTTFAACARASGSTSIYTGGLPDKLLDAILIKD